MAILAESRIRATIPRQQPAVEVEIEPRFRVIREPRTVLLFHSLHDGSKFLRFYEILTDCSNVRRSVPRILRFQQFARLFVSVERRGNYGEIRRSRTTGEETRGEKSRRAGRMR